MELVVTVKNIRYNENNKLIQQYRPLHDYSYFVYGVEKLCKAGHCLREAIELTAAECIEKDIMKDFLLDNYEEVFDMSLLRWNEKDAKADYQKYMTALQ